MRPARHASHKEVEGFRTQSFDLLLQLADFDKVDEGRSGPGRIAARQICAIGHCVAFHYAIFELIGLLL
jgi:hypothetical protein